MRLSIDSIALFFRENWQFLLSMMPVAVVLFLLFRKLFQLAKADLKGVIGAFLTVFGVLAALIVPGLIIDPDLWGKIMYLIILGAFFVFFLINDPKGVLKTVLITLAACAFVITVGLIFGFGAAAAVAANGFFCIFPALALRDIIRYRRLEKHGQRCTGQILHRTGRAGEIPVVAYTAGEKRCVKEMDGGFMIRSKKPGTPVDVAYDRNDPENACLVKTALAGSIVLLCIMTAVELAVLGITIFFFIYA